MPERVNQQAETNGLPELTSCLSPELLRRYLNVDNPMFASMIAQATDIRQAVESEPSRWERQPTPTGDDIGIPGVRFRPWRINEPISWEVEGSPFVRESTRPVGVSSLDIVRYDRMADPVSFSYSHLFEIRCIDARVGSHRDTFRCVLHHNAGDSGHGSQDLEPIPTRLADGTTTFIAQRILHEAIQRAKRFFEDMLGINRIKDTKRHANMALQESLDAIISEAVESRRESQEYRTSPNRRFKPCKRRATSGRSESSTSFWFFRFPCFFRRREQWHTLFTAKERKRNRKPLKDSVRKLYGFKPWLEERY